MAPVRVAALYDVHGNLPALEAALADAARARPDLLVLGGDYAWGPMPAPVVRRIRALERAGAVVLRGNADREVAARADASAGLDDATAAVNVWCADQLTAEERAWLGGLPERRRIEVAGLGEVLFCHGSPLADTDPIVDVTPDEHLEASLSGVEARTVVLGHTHLQFARTWGGTAIVNPGSVGLPFGDPGASWALLGPEVELRRAPYDARVAGAAFVAAGGPDAEGFAAHVADPPPTALARELYADAPVPRPGD